jgi:hypothetical protein
LLLFDSNLFLIIKVIRDEGLVENAARQGRVFSEAVGEMCKNQKWIKEFRGKGLFSAIGIHSFCLLFFFFFFSCNLLFLFFLILLFI